MSCFSCLPRRKGATCNSIPKSGCHGYEIVSRRKAYVECWYVGPFRPEHEGRTAERVETKHLLHLRSKPIVATAEVDRPRCDVNLQLGAGGNHRDARTARITRDSCSPSIAASVRTTTSPIAISSLTVGMWRSSNGPSTTSGANGGCDASHDRNSPRCRKRRRQS